MDSELLKQDLASLKEAANRIYDRYRAGTYFISTKPHHGLLFEEILGLIMDDYIPETLAQNEEDL